MQPFNYRDIGKKYNESKNIAEKILSKNCPITFVEGNVDVLEKLSALEQEITTDLKNLKENSDERPKYENMLNEIKPLKEDLSKFVKKLYKR
ncbi:MAG: hypothetical protein ACERKV_13195 [Clostridiaceae bacterium]